MEVADLWPFDDDLKGDISMFVSDRSWNRIRDQFTEDEKVKLRTAVTSLSICPGGVDIDVNFLPPHLKTKLVESMTSKDGMFT